MLRAIFNILFLFCSELKKQLAEMKDEQNKKMNILKKLDKYTYEAVCWLTQNQNTFRARVFLPIMLEVCFIKCFCVFERYNYIYLGEIDL